MTTLTPEGASEELFRALGTLVINFAALEESLHDAIWLAAGAPNENRAVNVLTAGMPLRTLIEKFGVLCKESPNLRASPGEVEGFCAHLNGLNQRRNELIHSAWMFRNPDNAPTRFKRTASIGKGFSLNVTPVPIAAIFALAEELRQAEIKVWGITP